MVRFITLIEEIENEAVFSVSLSPEIIEDGTYAVVSFGLPLDKIIQKSKELNRDFLTEMSQELAKQLSDTLEERR